MKGAGRLPGECLHLDHVTVREASTWLRRRDVLTDVCLDVPQGELVAVVAASGCPAKRALYAAASGTIALDEGAVRFAVRQTPPGTTPALFEDRGPARPGDVVSVQSLETIGRLSGWWRDGCPTVLEQVSERLTGRPTTVTGKWRDPVASEAAVICALLGIDNDLLNCPVDVLDLEMRAMVALAVHVVREPRVLLVDAPFCDYDPGIGKRLEQRLRSAADQLGTGVLYSVTQAVNALESDRMYEIRGTHLIDLDEPPETQRRLAAGEGSLVMLDGDGP